MIYNHGIIHHRRSIRLRDYDYSQCGAYFVTLCAHDRKCLFGEVKNGGMVLNAYGNILDECWRELPKHYPNIELDYHVIMPNHFHGVVMIVNHVGAGFKPAPTNLKPALIKYGLPEIIRGLKTFSGRKINQIRNIPGIPVWQRNYYEHIIRNEQDLNRIREYIQYNPSNWDKDLEHTEGC